MKKSFKDLWKKKDENRENHQKGGKEEFVQDLSQSQRAGMVFMIQLLMKEPVKMPDKELMISIMRQHLSEVECFTYDEKCAGFAASKYEVKFKEGNVPPQLMHFIRNVRLFIFQPAVKCLQQMMYGTTRFQERIVLFILVSMCGFLIFREQMICW